MNIRARGDFTKGALFRPMLSFTLPVLLSNIFQLLYNTTDAVVIGYVLGDSSLAAVGCAGAVYDLLVGFALGLGNGFSIAAARAFGSGSDAKLREVSAASIIISFATILTLSAASYLLCRPLLRVMATPEDIFGEVYAYTAVICLSLGVFFLYNLCAGLLRAVGNSTAPLVFLVFSSCLNVALDILFVASFGMGVAGAAYATVISQGLSAALSVVYIVKRFSPLIPRAKDFKCASAVYADVAAQGFSLAFMSCIVNAGTAILQRGVNSLGTLIVAGHTTARKIFRIFSGIIESMSTTVTTFVSQNRGAGKTDRIRRVMRYAYLTGAGFTVLAVIFVAFFAPAVSRLVSGSSEPEVIGNSARYLRVASPFFFVLGVLCSTRNALQSVGAKTLPVLSSVIELIGKILFTAFFVPLFGYTAIIFCEPVIWCLMTAELLPSFWLNKAMRPLSGVAPPDAEEEVAPRSQ